MDLSTNADASVSTVIQAPPGVKSVLFKMDTGSSAGLRIVSGHPLVVDGVTTEDEDGILLEVTDPPIVLPGANAYSCHTATDATAADFSVMGIA